MAVLRCDDTSAKDALQRIAAESADILEEFPEMTREIAGIKLRCFSCISTYVHNAEDAEQCVIPAATLMSLLCLLQEERIRISHLLQRNRLLTHLGQAISIRVSRDDTDAE